MQAQDPLLAYLRQTSFLRRYLPFKGYHLATCYP
jgi:hypothetical protein